MAPTLYMAPGSPPVRAVLMTADFIRLKLNLQLVNLRNGENLKEEYLKLNPLHTVPTLDDDGYILIDSHAIMPYLVQKYGKDDMLYPSDLNERGIVDSRLHFDNGILFNHLYECGYPLNFKGQKGVSQANRDNMIKGYGFLNTILENSKWVAGVNLTIADFSVYATISASDVIIPIDAEAFPNISRWIQKMENLPYTKVAKEGLNRFRGLVEPGLTE